MTLNTVGLGMATKKKHSSCKLAGGVWHQKLYLAGQGKPLLECKLVILILTQLFLKWNYMNCLTPF